MYRRTGTWRSESLLDRQQVLHAQWGLRFRARVYRRVEKHVDFQRRKKLLFKNNKKKNIFWGEIYRRLP